MGFVIAESCHIYNAVVNSLKSGGLRVVGPQSEAWNLMWTGVTKTDVLK